MSILNLFRKKEEVSLESVQNEQIIETVNEEVIEKENSELELTNKLESLNIEFTNIKALNENLEATLNEKNLLIAELEVKLETLKEKQNEISNAIGEAKAVEIVASLGVEQVEIKDEENISEEELLIKEYREDPSAFILKYYGK